MRLSLIAVKTWIELILLAFGLLGGVVWLTAQHDKLEDSVALAEKNGKSIEDIKETSVEYMRSVDSRLSAIEGKQDTIITILVNDEKK